jgi:hypothetical protein
MLLARLLVVTVTLTSVAHGDEIDDEVSRLRGLKIKKPIRRDTMDADAIRERLVTRLGEEMTADEIAAEQLALERWGLIAHGTSVHDVLVDVLTEQIAGFYDPADETLYIASGGDAESADMVMAHEIVHALQDQHFDLDTFTDLPDREADALLARQALIEGDGMVSMFELVLARENIPPPWGQEDALAMMAKSMETGDESLLDRSPLVVRDLLMFPYTQGLRFVARLRATRPWKKVNEVFQKRPPASTEQILHPELYLADEAPVTITAKTPAVLSGWRTAHETVWGEAGWSVVLRQHGVSLDRATDAAAGWGGDRVVVYARDGSGPRDAVGIAFSAWDADIDAMEAAESATAALDALVTGTIIEESKTRTVWLGADARISLVERREDRVLVVVGAPLVAQDTIADDVWKNWD